MVFLVNLGRVVFAPLIEPLAADFAASPAEFGAVATLAWLGSAVSRVPTGYALTRVPRHVVVLASGTGLTVAALFTAFAPSVPVLMVGASLIGLAAGSYFVAGNPLVSELFPEGVGRALGIHGMATGLAAAAGCFLMAGLTNYPICLAPGMGTNAYFSFLICGVMGVPCLFIFLWMGIFGNLGICRPE